MNPLHLTMSRRAALGLGVITASSATLAACAGGSTNAGGSANGGNDGNGGSNGALQFWSNHPGSSQDIEQEIIAEWNEANPDIPVELVTGGSNYEELAQKFNAALSGGELPDMIVASDVTWFNFALNGQTTNLDEYWDQAGVDASSYVDTLREDYAYEGGHYGVPYSRSTALMYWNTDILEEAGLPTDRGPESWEEFDEWAQKIKEKYPDQPVCGSRWI